jgi:hypothetical protein
MRQETVELSPPLETSDRRGQLYRRGLDSGPYDIETSDGVVPTKRTSKKMSSPVWREPPNTAVPLASSLSRSVPDTISGCGKLTLSVLCNEDWFVPGSRTVNERFAPTVVFGTVDTLTQLSSPPLKLSTLTVNMSGASAGPRYTVGELPKKRPSK